MKKQFLLLIISLAFASVLAKVEFLEPEFGDCPVDIAEDCLKLDKSKCCGTKENTCCSEEEYNSQFPNLEDAKAEPRGGGIFRGIAKLIGFIVGAIIFVVVVCCICCFCCPFCLFSKHRNGRVIRRNEQAQNQEQQGLQQQHQQQPQQIIQTVPMHPNPPTGYPPQQAYPNQAYPPAPQPGYGYPQPGQSNVMPYPDNPPPYPGPPLTQAPPPQTIDASYEKQPAFNPNL